MAHLFTSITFSLGRQERGRRGNLLVGFLQGGFGSTQENQECRTERESILGRVNVQNIIWDKSDSVVWHTAIFLHSLHWAQPLNGDFKSIMILSLLKRCWLFFVLFIYSSCYVMIISCYFLQSELFFRLWSLPYFAIFGDEKRKRKRSISLRLNRFWQSILAKGQKIEENSK